MHSGRAVIRDVQHSWSESVDGTSEAWALLAGLGTDALSTNRIGAT